MLARLRQELGDTTSPNIWDDTYLENLLIEANDWYSRLYPRGSTATQDVVADQRTFTVTPGTFEVLHVECPPGNQLPLDSNAFSADPTAWSGTYRQAWAVFGDTLYLRNAAAGDEVGAANLVMFLQVAWDRPDPVETWNGPENDVRLLVLWAAREAWLWHDGLTQRLQRKVAQYSQAQRFGDMLNDELRTRARRNSFGSRTLEVAG
jgi:hypothetical protein